MGLLNGWHVRDRRQRRILPGVRVNYNGWKIFRATIDGPGGRKVRDAFTSLTLGKPGTASWNSRTDRYTVDAPIIGSIHKRAGWRRPRRGRP